MRLQLALNVADLDKAVDFYTRMFGVEPAKIRPGYANFAVADPPLKLVLFEGQGEPGTINHLGVETETADEVVAAEARLTEAGLETTGVDDTQCCYAAEDRDVARPAPTAPAGSGTSRPATASSSPTWSSSPAAVPAAPPEHIAGGCRGPGSIETDLLGLALG